MTVKTTTTAGRRRAVRHYLEMVLAMLAGMVVLGEAVALLLRALGAPPLGVETDALVMATTMAVGMAGWMRYRGHRWVPIVEMSASMYVPFVVLFVPLWTGVLSADGMLLWGHVLMFPAMAGAMALRPAEYCGGAR